MVARFSALLTSWTLLPRNITFLLLVLISVRGWVNSRTLVWPEGLGTFKISPHQVLNPWPFSLHHSVLITTVPCAPNVLIVTEIIIVYGITWNTQIYCVDKHSFFYCYSRWYNGLENQEYGRRDPPCWPRDTPPSAKVGKLRLLAAVARSVSSLAD
jgi:hypothetical protein